MTVSSLRPILGSVGWLLLVACGVTAAGQSSGKPSKPEKPVASSRMAETLAYYDTCLGELEKKNIAKAKQLCALALSSGERLKDREKATASSFFQKLSATITQLQPPDQLIKQTVKETNRHLSGFRLKSARKAYERMAQFSGDERVQGTKQALETKEIEFNSIVAQGDRALNMRSRPGSKVAKQLYQQASNLNKEANLNARIQATKRRY